MSAIDMALERPSVWQQLADDSGYSDLVIVVSTVTLAGAIAAAVVQLQSHGGNIAGYLLNAWLGALGKASGGAGAGAGG